ncbi:MAG: hypothetical protein JNK87_42945 [Bryobacterales bacterium]|nr:hypothetical protein [Bryobacterales bacterium]
MIRPLAPFAWEGGSVLCLGILKLPVTLTSTQAQALQAKAQSHGISPQAYVRQVLARDLAPDWLRDSWASAEQSGVAGISMEEIEAEISAARRDRHRA